MKSPFKKLRWSGRDTQRSLAQLDELSQASQDMQDIKDCYDTLLSTAAATANSAYEFSESLRELGECLLEKTSLNDDEDSGRVLLMMGKAQFEIQNLVDTYRSHISRTITVPSESLLNELRIVEDMKRQCDEKRIWYDDMKVKHKERKKRFNSKKGEYVSSNQVRVAKEEFEEDATLFIFRVKSLKGGQSRSLLTQAARHHAAQMCFFRKALKSLETIDPYVELVTKQHHIDYQFIGGEDDDRDSVFLTDDEDDDDDDDEDETDDEQGELSFEYQVNQVSVEEDLTFPQLSSVKEEQRPLSGHNIHIAGSKSAPLSSMGPSDKFRQSSARKLYTYVLPTPVPTQLQANNSNMWHSSPLERKENDKPINKRTPAPPPKRYAFSSPLATTPYLSVSGTSKIKISELHELPRPPGFSAPLLTSKLHST